MNSSSTLLVVGSGRREYRELLFQSLASEGLWLLTHEEPTWERRYLLGYTVAPRLSSAQISARLNFLDAALREVTSATEVAGVVTFEELYTPATCWIADQLNLPSFGSEAVENCRDKRRSRGLLRAAGLRQPESVLAENVDAAQAVANRIGYPVVLKPRGLAGSIGVVKVDGPDALPGAFAGVATLVGTGAQRHAGGVLVEGFIQGPEISIDCAVVSGKITPLYLARKRFGPPPYFEETGQHVDSRDPLLEDEALLSTLRQAHAALRIDSGVTHTEVRLTAEGPVVIEVNSRMGGDLVPHTALHATGISGADIAAKVARGLEFQLLAPIQKVASNEIIYADREGVIARVSVPKEYGSLGLIGSGILIEPGTRVSLPPDGYMARCAFVMTSAAKAADCDLLLSSALQDVIIEFVGEHD